jgi:hypothetical protein
MHLASPEVLMVMGLKQCSLGGLQRLKKWIEQGKPVLMDGGIVHGEGKKCLM